MSLFSPPSPRKRRHGSRKRERKKKAALSMKATAAAKKGEKLLCSIVSSNVPPPLDSFSVFSDSSVVQLQKRGKKTKEGLSKVILLAYVVPIAFPLSFPSIEKALLTCRPFAKKKPFGSRLSHLEERKVNLFFESFLSWLAWSF